MPKFRLNHNYSSGRLVGGREGDEYEMPLEDAEAIERDSPGSLKAIGRKNDKGEDLDDINLSDLMSEDQALELEALREQIPTIDIDIEDKAREIPGEGNKMTPSSGFPIDPRVNAQRATLVNTSNRQQTNPETREAGQSSQHKFDAAQSADTTANARVTEVVEGTVDPAPEPPPADKSGQGNETDEQREARLKNEAEAAATAEAEAKTGNGRKSKK